MNTKHADLQKQNNIELITLANEYPLSEYTFINKYQFHNSDAIPMNIVVLYDENIVGFIHNFSNITRAGIILRELTESESEWLKLKYG